MNVPMIRPALSVLALVIPSIAHAQEPPDTFRLREIVVSATRQPAQRGAVPAAVTVLYGDDLRARGIRFLADALRQVPGATIVQSGSRGGITSLFLRGGESNYVQVLVDGVVMNDPGGAFDFGQLTTDNIDRIEVVRGPVSVLYGSDAVAGVVHVFTRSGGRETRIASSIGLGRTNRITDGPGGCAVCAETGEPNARHAYTQTLDVDVTGSRRGVDYGFAASRFETDGVYAVNNGYDNLTLSGRARVAAGPRTEVVAGVRWTDALFRYPTDGAGRWADRNQYRSSESLAVSAELGHTFTPRVAARLTLTSHNGEYLTNDLPDGPADTLGFFASRSLSDIVRRKADLRADLAFPSATTVTLGIEAERQEGTSRFDSDSEFGPFSSASRNHRSNGAGYVQLVTNATAPALVTLGGRADHNDRFGTHLTWRAGANVRAGATLLRAAAGTAFKEPTFFENYAEGFTRGNPELEPEQSRNIEIGIEQRFLDDRAAVGATAFHQRFENLIQYIGAPPDPGAPNYVNLAEARSRGLEIEAHYAAPAGTTASASYTFLDTEVLDEGTGDDPLFQAGQTLIRRPEHRANVSLTQSLTAWLRSSASLVYTGARDDLDFIQDFNGARVRLPAFSTLDAALEAAPFAGRDLSIILRIENLLDERYDAVANFPAAGSSLFIGLRTRTGI